VKSIKKKKESNQSAREGALILNGLLEYTTVFEG